MFSHVTPIQKEHVTAVTTIFRFAFDVLRAGTSASALLLAGWLSVGMRPLTPILAQIITAQPGPPGSESIPEFALRQGGAFAILALVLFYYRRDWRDLTDYKGQRETILMDLIKENSKSSADMAAALRENNIVVHQAKNILASYVGPAQRAGDVPRT